MTLLEKLNPHPRDDEIEFDEPSHTYTIGGNSDYMSATTFVHSNFGVFDEDLIIKRMMASKNWPNSKYFGMTADEIKKAWEVNRDEAANAGTLMHATIEDYYNGIHTLESLPDTPEMKAFKEFHEYTAEEGLVPFRTEWRVFHEELRIAGTIDMVYKGKDGRLYIVDWKRCRCIKKDVNPKFQNDVSLNPELSRFYDTNYYHYMLQLNLYKHIIETKYGYEVAELNLVNLHPNKSAHTGAEFFDVDIMTEAEIKSLYEWRELIKNKNA